MTMQQRLLRQFSLLNNSYVLVMRQLDSLGSSTQAYSLAVAERDPIVLQQTLLVQRTLFPFENNIEAQIDELVLQLDLFTQEPLSYSDEAFIRNIKRTLLDLKEDNREIGQSTEVLLLALNDPNVGFTRERIALGAQVATFSSRIADLSDMVDLRTSQLLSSATASAKAATFRVIFVTIGAVLIALIVIVFVRRSLRPIRRLTEAAHRMKKGNYATIQIEAGRDEVGVLTREFAAMAEAIQSRDKSLRQKNQELERAYKAELSAQQAQVKAERLAAIGEMSSRITHELRNPLSSIGLNVEMLQEELEESEVDPDVLEMLSSIEAEVERLRSLTEGYLSLARPHVGRTVLVDLQQLSQEVLIQLAAELDLHQITLQIFGGSTPVTGDAHQLRQVWINLIQNAVAAIKEQPLPRQIQIKTNIENENENENAIMIIDDNGPGIAEKNIEHIFQPFVSSRVDGTGLGLSICRRIITELDGSLVATAHGKLGGASFKIILPARS